MEDAFVINGGKPLHGEVSLSGAKNIALKVLIASLLFDTPVTLHNIPRIRDVYELMNLINALGARAAFTDNNTVYIEREGIKEKTLDLLFASKIRVSFMFFAPLLHIFKDCFIPNPGGCRLGARSIDRSIEGLKALGVQVEYASDTGYFHASLPQNPGGRYTFAKPSHTGTELLIMLAVLSDKKTILENAALEPEIDDLIAFFNNAGAKIRRDGTSIVIDGVSSLRQTEPFSISTDRNEAVTFASLAIATKGSVTVMNIKPDELGAFHKTLDEMGGKYEVVTENSVRYWHEGPLHAVTIETAPHPGFMTDWQPPMAVLLTQAEGKSVIHERMFENRFSYVEELHKIGASIEFMDPHIDNPQEYYEFNYDPGKEYQQAIEIHGPQQLHNGVLKIADLRAGATLAIGALIAPGRSVINGASHLERGYEDFVGKVRGLGGDIAKV